LDKGNHKVSRRRLSPAQFNKIMGNSTDEQIEERQRRLFGDADCRRQVAALPWRRTGDVSEFMLITSRDTGRWVLPKGWIEKNEKPWRAAEREAEEEAGLRGNISRYDLGRYFYAKVQRIGPAIPCEVAIFPLEVTKVSDKWREKGVRVRRWFSAADAASLVEEPDLSALIRRFAERQHSR
jgi:8-oxo-dGTP pyrophosphatase MutT (NUDIX family)